MLNLLQLNLAHKRKGLVLTELLTAISISVILISALYAIYLTSYRSYQRSVNRSELDQNARISLERISRDLRQTERIITILPPTNTDPLNPASNVIKFVDGHNIDKIQYIEYKLENNNLIREISHYYFSSDPDIWVQLDATDSYGNPPVESIDESAIKADKVQNLEFYGSNIIVININVSSDNASLTYKTKTLGRNVQWKKITAMF